MDAQPPPYRGCASGSCAPGSKTASNISAPPHRPQRARRITTPSCPSPLPVAAARHRRLSQQPVTGTFRRRPLLPPAAAAAASTRRHRHHRLRQPSPLLTDMSAQRHFCRRRPCSSLASVFAARRSRLAVNCFCLKS